MVIAVIIECNPPHNGHRFLLDSLRSHFGNDTSLIGIMSGNYVQRGEPAFLPKTIRAEAALSLGFDLILELPFPYSMASADYFALAGVSIAESLGCVDMLAFGSECGDLASLEEIVNHLESPDFTSLRAHINPKIGYASGFAEDYRKAFPDGPSFPTDANDILAIAYLRELRRRKSKIRPYAVKRVGNHLKNATSYRSAGEIREAIREGDFASISDSFSENIGKILSYSVENGICPTDISRLDNAVLSYFRLNPDGADYAEAGGGLYKRLASLANEAVGISDLCRLAQTKNYTAARIRRAILFSFFGITSADLKEDLRYTQFLAANDSGLSLLKTIGKCGGISVLTKPTDIQTLSPEAKKQKMLSDRADRIFPLCFPKPQSVKETVSFTPFLSHK